MKQLPVLPPLSEILLAVGIFTGVNEKLDMLVIIEEDHDMLMPSLWFISSNTAAFSVARQFDFKGI